MNLLIDIDGVINDYDWQFILKESLGVDVAIDFISSYCIEDILGVSTAQVDDLFYKVVRRPANLADGCLSVLNRLHEEGHSILIYTNRLHFMNIKALERWLREAGVPFTRIINSQWRGAADYHINDSVSRLVNYPSSVKTKLLFDQPWNRSCLNITGELQRVHNWKEIEETIYGKSRRKRSSVPKRKVPVRSS
jgi:5'(3')-deoxyribonucleotidase